MFPLARFKVQDESMQPTLKSGDYLVVNKLSKKFSVGDIVVFEHGDKFLVKRIGKIVGENFFVVGDNKNHSNDSRQFGTIKNNSIIGKVCFILAAKLLRQRKEQTVGPLDQNYCAQNPKEIETDS